MSTDRNSTLDRRDRKLRKWVAPQLLEVADLSRIIATGKAGGKTVVQMDGNSQEAMV